MRNVLGAEDEHTEDILMDIQQNLSDRLEEYAETHDEDADAFVLDKDTLGKILEECNVPEEKANRIEKSMDEAFGEKVPVAENVIDAKALVQNEIRLERKEMENQIVVLNKQLDDKTTELEERTVQLKEKEEEIETYRAETREYDVVLHVKPEKANKIHASMIDGKKCIVIPMEEDEQATINGVNTVL